MEQLRKMGDKMFFIVFMCYDIRKLDRLTVLREMIKFPANIYSEFFKKSFLKTIFTLAQTFSDS